MLRGNYHPAAAASREDPRQRVADSVLAGTFTADELLSHYCTLVYAKSRNYSQVAEQLGVDRRTVKARVKKELLAEMG
jgi:predicted regulator of amino acid metabolism with ACT domain